MVKSSVHGSPVFVRRNHVLSMSGCASTAESDMFIGSSE
jgi:hypothetical protein